jgi:hypothetical protein
MKSIALIDTRSEVPGISLGILVSTHPDVMAASLPTTLSRRPRLLSANPRPAVASGREQMNQSMSLIRETVLWRLAPGKKLEFGEELKSSPNNLISEPTRNAWRNCN